MARWTCSGHHIFVAFVVLCVISFAGLLLVKSPRDSHTISPAVSPSQVDGYLSISAIVAPALSLDVIAAGAATTMPIAWGNPFMYAPSKRSRALCVTFLDLTSSSFGRWKANMDTTGEMCSWVYMVYKYDAATKDKKLEQLHAMLATSFHSMRGGQPTYDVVFAPPRASIVNDIAELCQQGLMNSSHYRRYKLEKTCQALVQLGSNPVQASQYNALVYPKILLFPRLLGRLKDHQYVWIIDGDISLKGHNTSSFLHTAQCAFSTPLLVAQPTVAENTQTYKYLNKGSWKKRSVIAAQTGFVEIQVPLLDARFFEWFVVSFVLPLVPAMHVLGADWGFDELFCNAARLYRTVTSSGFQQQLRDADRRLPDGNAGEGDVVTKAWRRWDTLVQQHQGRPAVATAAAAGITASSSAASAGGGSAKNTKGKSKSVSTVADTGNMWLHDLIQASPPQCGVVLRGGSVHHANSKETNALLGYEVKKTLNEKMRNIVRATFPSFYALGKGAYADPLHPDSKLALSNRLQPGCT